MNSSELEDVYKAREALLARVKLQQAQLDAMCRAIALAKEGAFSSLYDNRTNICGLQTYTQDATALFREISPDGGRLNPLYEQVIQDAAQRARSLRYEEQQADGRPIIEAFTHASFFVEQLVRLCRLEAVPQVVSAGQLCVLQLFNLE